MSTVEEFSKKVSALVAAITEGRKNGDVNDAQWARLTELAGDVNHAVDRFNKGEGGQMAADSALAALETAVVAVLGAPAPTGGTPVPAPAAPQPTPATPTAPPSGTRKWVSSQATPASPVTPVVPPSSPGMDLESMKLDIASAVKDGVIELLTPMAQVLPSDNTGFLPVASKAEVDELGERFKVLDTKVKAINTNAGRVKAPLKKVWPSLGLGLLVGLLIGLGLFSVIGIILAIVLGVAGFALVAGVMIALFNSDRNTAPAQ